MNKFLFYLQFRQLELVPDEKKQDIKDDLYSSLFKIIHLFGFSSYIAFASPRYTIYILYLDT
jgi:hypothetical protein